MKYKYNKEELEKIVNESLSISEVCLKLNIVPNGGNYKTIKSKIKIWQLNSEHFTGQGWNVGMRYKPIKNKIPLDEILIENSSYLSSNNLKNRLILEGFKEKKCECCGLSDWLKSNITLELHHINGRNLDNRIENLQLLCPNCHSQTPNHRGNNKKSEKKIFKNNEYAKFKNSIKIEKPKCIICGTLCNRYNAKYCSDSCSKISQKKIKNRPHNEILKADIQSLGYRGTGRKYGVSDNTIRKWLK